VKFISFKTKNKIQFIQQKESIIIINIFLKQQFKSIIKNKFLKKTKTNKNLNFFLKFFFQFKLNQK